MRSFVDKSFSDFFLSCLDKYLLKDSDKFLEKTFERRSKELDEESKRAASDDKGAKYSSMAASLKHKFGYDTKAGEVREESKESDDR